MENNPKRRKIIGILAYYQVTYFNKLFLNDFTVGNHNGFFQRKYAFPVPFEGKNDSSRRKAILVEGVFKGKVLFCISHIHLVQNEPARNDEVINVRFQHVLSLHQRAVILTEITTCGGNCVP